MDRIHKCIAIVVQDNKFLMVRKHGKDIWTSLGGKVEPGETEEECLLREIKEELDCDARLLRKLGDFEEKAVFDDAVVRLSAYHTELLGSVKLIDPELQEYRFIGKEYEKDGVKLPPLIERQIIPRLVSEGLLRW